MTRLARIVIPELPHHVTRRGNRREAVFFQDGDHEVYRDLLAEQTRKAGIEVWAYCLMRNHVRLILTPKSAAGLGYHLAAFSPRDEGKDRQLSLLRIAVQAGGEPR